MKSDLHEEVSENDNIDIDEELDAAAQGQIVERDSDADEIDAMGEAAGLKDKPGKPFRGVEKVEGRDEKRWELDPSSKDPETGVS